ncbi:glutamyl-tRNA reductase [Humisphaera borealis]|uniref:Glutamyl-tRNA reductase n=1 Tax=Humisphaera borealis TaxID=2807512 RepID=A0A7M2WT75_9BACT|nr:glutamyl-tRNA reductase [Humisphaera borealis]QOV88372.1 glutamyl-tRNA reductase [Humisphaera borealis]
MQRLLLLGLNHTTAPLEVREKLAFSPAQRDAAVAALRARFPECEAVLLSTCNRVEIYVSRGGTFHHPHPVVEELVDFLAESHALPPEGVRPHLYHKAGREAALHLFRVASSLDSLVLGENQILGQVREAYETAKAQNTTGAILNPLFQRAVAVGKQVRSDTALAEGRLSIASVAVEYAGRIFETFSDKTVLCIGAGKMATLVLEHLVALAPGKLLLCNRNADRATALAEQFKGAAVPFDRLADHLAAADIVVTSTGSIDPIITRAMFTKVLRRRRYRPVFLIDIAVPRDIEASVGELEQVYLYNVDDLQQVVAGTQQQRQSAVQDAEAIVSKHLDEFAVWHRQREMGPTIDRLYKRYHRMAREELDRTINKLPAAAQQERAALEEMTRRIVNKLLHRPIHAMRHADPEHPEIPYVHAMEKLFDLEEELNEAVGGTGAAAEKPASTSIDQSPPTSKPDDAA